MSESTDAKTYRWMPWAIAGSLAVLIIVLAAYTTAYYGQWLNLKSYLPWENAQGIDTLRAINEFSEGTVDEGSYWYGRITSLIGILLLFVIGPSFWIYGESKEKSEDDESLTGNPQKGLAWYAGVVVVMLGLIYAVSSTVIKASIFPNTWENAAKSRNMDQLRGELASLAFDVAEQYYLSQTTDPTGVENSDALSLRSLDLEALKNFPEESKNEFIPVEIESDSTLMIYGVGYKEGPNSNFENANGDRGKIQLAVRVDPRDDIFEFVTENTNRF